MSPPSPNAPRLRAGVDLRALPLNAMEGYVLSRIDGTTTEADIVNMTGLDAETVSGILARLVSLGAVEHTAAARAASTPSGPGSSARPNDTPHGRTPTPTQAPAGVPSGRPREAPDERSNTQLPPNVSTTFVHTSLPPPDTGDPAAPLYDPRELEEDVDLDVERRRTILDTFYSLDAIDHYALLGVARDAERKVIRKTYFERAKIFHPDTMFRKRLGTFKPKMEVIFKRITEAYEVLNKKESRADYDAYLMLTSTTRDLEHRVAATRASPAAAPATPTPSPMPTPTPGVSQRPTFTKASSPAPSGEARPETIPPPPPSPTEAIPPPPPQPTVPPAAAGPVLSAEERKRRAQELLQKRLFAATGKAPSQPPPDAAAAMKKVEPKAALHDLARSLRQVAEVTGGQDRVSRHLAEARRLESSGDMVAASNAYRLALTFAPERPDVIAEYERTKKIVAKSLSDNYQKQAEYEEKFGKHGAAAISWAKVCEGRPGDVNAFRKVAECLLAAQGDMRRAQKYAQRAVELDSKDAKTHKTLGRVYLAAGLRLNAKRELEQSAKLDPADELVKNLLKELKD